MFRVTHPGLAAYPKGAAMSVTQSDAENFGNMSYGCWSDIGAEMADAAESNTRQRQDYQRSFGPRQPKK